MKLLTTAEAAAVLRKPQATLRFWRSTRTDGPPSFRIGGSVVYDEDELLAWVQEQKAADAARRQVSA